MSCDLGIVYSVEWWAHRVGSVFLSFVCVHLFLVFICFFLIFVVLVQNVHVHVVE